MNEMSVEEQLKAAEAERDSLRRAIVEHRTTTLNAGTRRVIAKAADAKHRADEQLWKTVEGV